MSYDLLEITTIPIADKHMYTHRYIRQYSQYKLTSLCLIVILHVRTEAESTSGSVHAQVDRLVNAM